MLNPATRSPQPYSQSLLNPLCIACKNWRGFNEFLIAASRSTYADSRVANGVLDRPTETTH
jgi:hypothetical protein